LEPDLPEAQLDDSEPLQLRDGDDGADRRERRSRQWQDDNEDDDYDDRPRRKRRRIRRDLVPHRGALVLTLGILSIALGLVCSVLCSIVGPLLGVGLALPAVLLGHFDMRAISSGNMDPDGEGQTRIGMILGYIGLGLSVLMFLLCGAYLVVMLTMSNSGVMR
jgi:hypothetical protein